MLLYSEALYICPAPVIRVYRCICNCCVFYWQPLYRAQYILLVYAIDCSLQDFTSQRFERFWYWIFDRLSVSPILQFCRKDPAYHEHIYIHCVSKKNCATFIWRNICLLATTSCTVLCVLCWFILARDCVWPPVPTSWSPPHAGLHLATAQNISGRRNTGMERVTAQCHLRAVSLVIQATSDNFSASAITAWITLITVSWSWSASIQYHVIPGELNWTELNCRPIDNHVALRSMNGKN